MTMTTCSDPRHITAGLEIPTESYSDQPYIVRTDDGAWLCTMTTGAGHEGQSGQHVVSTRSTDHGRTWSEPMALEPANGPEASYAVMLKVPSGRIYAFYNHNTDNVRKVKADDPPFRGGHCSRVDSLGHYVFKYSDDHGRSWSKKRYSIPMRVMDIDRRNADGGELLYFWNVGKPFVIGSRAFASIHKVGGFGSGFFTRSEGALLASDNLLTERDPARIRWETLPKGEIGLRTPRGGGPVAEEQSYVVLSDDSIYAVYRTIDGHPACSISRDGTRTWSPPTYQTFADGRRMKHPRAANFVWRCANGKYLYWFHNHGGRRLFGRPELGYEDRNPVWLCGGVEAETAKGRTIQWSQPDVLLYDDDSFVRMSYPDLVEEGADRFVSETQKDQARVHKLPDGLAENLWSQFEAPTVTDKGLLLDVRASDAEPLPKQAHMPTLLPFVARDGTRPDYGGKDLRAGFTLELWVRFESLKTGQVLLDTVTSDDGDRPAMGEHGIRLTTRSGARLGFRMADARTEASWSSDAGTLRRNQWQHVVLIVDGGPKLILFVVDGRLCDGGDTRQFGWGRFSPDFRAADGAPEVQIAPKLQGAVRSLRVYDRALRVSEAVNNFRASGQ